MGCLLCARLGLGTGHPAVNVKVMTAAIESSLSSKGTATREVSLSERGPVALQVRTAGTVGLGGGGGLHLFTGTFLTP